MMVPPCADLSRAGHDFCWRRDTDRRRRHGRDQRHVAGNQRRLSWDLTRQAAQATAKLSAFVVFILIRARVFSLTFYGVDGHRWVESLLLVAWRADWVLVFVNAFVFVLAFFRFLQVPSSSFRCSGQWQSI
jgi:hypothetical protein